VPPDPLSPLPPSAFGPPPGPANDDTLAWVGVACSSISWLLCCCAPIPFVGFLSNLLGGALALGGLVCGILAYRTAKRVGGRTDLPSIAMVVGGAGVALRLGLVALVLVLIAVIGLAGVTEYVQRASGQ
jgi:hypothetical protein